MDEYPASNGARATFSSDGPRTDARWIVLWSTPHLVSGTQAQRMNVVAFTELRPEETRDPLEAMSGDATVVSVASQGGLLARLVAAARDGKRAIERESPDAIVVYHGAGPLGLLCVLFSAYYSIPLIIRINGDIRRQHREKIAEYRNDGNWTMWAGYWMYYALTKLTFGWARGYVVVSRDLKTTLHRRLRRPGSRIQVVHGPLQPDQYRTDSQRPLEELGITEDHVLLTVTNLNFRGKYRGIRRTLRDVVPLLEQHENAAYVIAGAGRYHDRLVRDLENIPNEDVRRRIYAPGFVDEVEELYAGADVFVYVSYIDGYPNAVLEAQAAGLPVVANRAFGMAEQITDGDSGILIDPDRDDLRPVLERLLTDRDRRRELGRRAARKIDQRNRPEAIGPQLQEAIERIVRDP